MSESTVKRTHEPAVERVMDAYKHKQIDLGNDLGIGRYNVNRWVKAGLVPAGWILRVVKVAKKRDEMNERKTLPPEDVLIKQLLRDHERSSKAHAEKAAS